MKLYKFRALCLPGTFKRTCQILETGQFWCSRFWDLNDPMEGVYRLQQNSPDYRSVFTQKAQRVLCSFSDESAVHNPLMWGYYGNGFKGLAIGIDVPEASVRRVNYIQREFAPDVHKSTSEQVDDILCTKLSAWSHEAEYRFLSDGEKGLKTVGSLRSITFGIPYPSKLVDFSERKAKLKHLDQYLGQCRRVAAVARDKGLRVDTAVLENGSIRVYPGRDVHEWYDEQ